MPINLEMKMENALRAELERVHLEYIRHEECPGKIQLKCQLQELCEKWLSCKPHSSKFMLTELPDILRTSLLRSQANTNQELALDEVANAFLALAKYAANIVSQPWRQEFYTIKRYGGYFLQEVGLVLSDIDKLMAFIGYQSSDNNTFNLNIQFSPTVVLQKLPRVALDYMLVATECQLMSRIMAAVNISDVSVNLYRLLGYREYHIGSWEITVQGLMYEARFYNFSNKMQHSTMEPRSQGLPFGAPPSQFSSNFIPASTRTPVPPGLLVETHLTSNYSPAPTRNPVPSGLVDSQLTSNYSPASSRTPVPPGLLIEPHHTSNYSTALTRNPVPHCLDPPEMMPLSYPSDGVKRVIDYTYDSYKDFQHPMQSYMHSLYRPAQQEATEHCSHANQMSTGRTAYERLDKGDIYMNSSFPQSLAEPLMPQQVKWHVRPEGHATVPRYHAPSFEEACTEPKMSSASKRGANLREEEIFYSDEEIEENNYSEIQQSASDARRYCSTAPRKGKSSCADTDNLTRGRDSWSKLGEAQLLAHNTQEHKHETEQHKRSSHIQNGLQTSNLAPAKSHISEPQPSLVKNKSEKRTSNATKSADSRDESWEYVFSKLEIQSPTANQEADVSQDREKVAKTVAALQLSVPPQLLESAKEIYNRPNELDYRRYQEFIRNAPEIDGVVQHPIMNMSWPERFKYLYYRGEREALVGYTELLAGETSKAAPPKPAVSPPQANEDNTWACQTCTWLNTEAKTICGMCNKSRNLLTAAEPTNPGPQCVQCTLVNQTGRDYCEACGASLDLLYI